MNLKAKLYSMTAVLAMAVTTVVAPAPAMAAGHWIKGLTWTVTPRYEYVAFTTDPGYVAYDTWTAVKNGVVVASETNRIVDYMTKTCDATHCDWVGSTTAPGPDWAECAEYVDVVYDGNNLQAVPDEAKQTIKFSTCAPNRAGGHWIENLVWTLSPNSDYFAFTTDPTFDPYDTWSAVKDGVKVFGETNRAIDYMTKTCDATHCDWVSFLSNTDSDWVACGTYTDVVKHGSDDKGASMSVSFNTCPTARSSVSGVAFEDLNVNGQWDASEPTLGGMWFKVTNGGGWFVCGYVGNDNTFGVTVSPGTYNVIPVAPKGYRTTTPMNTIGVAQDSTGNWVTPYAPIGFVKDTETKGENCDQFSPAR